MESIYTMEEIIEYYKRLGLEFVCFTEHSSDPARPTVLTLSSPEIQSLLAQTQKIITLNRRQQVVATFAGVESNIMFDERNLPTLDVPHSVLRQLDLVVASRHALPLDKEKEPFSIQQSLLAAIESGVVDMIGHPDRYTRKDGQQPNPVLDAYWGIWPEVLQTMAENSVAFEVNFNSQPLPQLVQMAARAKVPFLLNFDAHDLDQYKSSKTVIDDQGAVVKQQWAQRPLNSEEQELFDIYKQYRLTGGPGIKSILRLVRWIHRLQSWGVTQDQVVNSSLDNLLRFLTVTRGKSTDNLRLLTDRRQG